MGQRNYLKFRGVNFWSMGSSLGLNLFWSILVLVVAYVLRTRVTNSLNAWGEAAMIFAFFIGPFLIALLTGNMAGDGRGPTYGFYGSLLGVIPVALVMLPTGLFGVFCAAAVLAGVFNGGLLVEMLKNRKYSGK